MNLIIDAARRVVCIDVDILPEGAGYELAVVADGERAKFATANATFSLASDDTVAVTVLPPVPPPVPPPNANQTLIAHLNSLALTPGGEADVLRQGVITVLAAQPAVPAV